MSIVAIVAALIVAGGIGAWLNRRAGVLRELPSPAISDESPTEADAAAAAFLGLEPGRPAVVHFSAPWCGPCAGVRRVVEKVCDELGGVAHHEIDIDANPEAARTFAVLSLPTTVIFDTAARQRYRVSGVPTHADLRSALEPLLA
ncbi:thiol reductase thioredoxin [Mycolicibacter minnesotensis]|uniref:Thiol reductase thioredoxin n=1 Tax=Mycolicibacter minnesotensis TaxID=1118379 RepID=A0A7I7R355_9MYCO|nr:thioredoxin family protein [Mycolicibacter minnesotensis]ORA99374.1 thiol reductase thioredoxin [Mycolicibacter minnesotensis]BBY33015.1 thiol reductase thioredoxin [Mycolicibacter minnesotensis]